MLGIVTVSITVTVSLTYNTTTKVAEGDATLTLSVDVLMFHKSFSRNMHESFGDGDPSFIQAVSEPQWIRYANTFAPDTSLVIAGPPGE